jgi:iron(III) transport system ATP-binding protein
MKMDMERSPQEREMRPYLSIHNVTKAFGHVRALSEVSLDIFDGEFVCILGPSGCGKTTLLRIIAGLEEQNTGHLFLKGEEISRLPPSKRNFGIVFQSYALFPNLTVVQNIAYGLNGRRKSREETTLRVQELLTLVGLKEHKDKYPAQLSGGQQQRVALARALALSPSLLLLDEPLSALDARVREKLRHEIRQLHERLKITTVMVTHDQGEALTMADRIVVMDEGRIVQLGLPQDIYGQPTNPFVADFIGSMNFLKDVIVQGQNLCQFGEVKLAATSDHYPPGAKVTLAIRPEDIQVLTEDEKGPNQLVAQVNQVEFRGPFYRALLLLSTNSHNGKKAHLYVDIPTEKLRRLGIRKEGVVSIQLPPDRLLFFAEGSG